jgi:glycosyltransferase involved in cell wall biosynthesis
MASIDVAVPCYQYGRFLRDSVGSILSQAVGNLRVLIIDNASTDNSLEVANQLASEDPRVGVCAHRTNLGHHASYNEAIEWASADYFTLLDADDLLAPGCLARAITIMEQHPNVVFVYGQEQAASFAAREQPPFDPSNLEASWTILDSRTILEELCHVVDRIVPGLNPGTTIVRRTNVQKKIGYYRKEIAHADDLEMWLRLASAGDVARTSAIHGIRRLHGSQVSEAYREIPLYLFTQRHEAFASFFQHEGRSMPNAKSLNRLVRTKLAKEALWSGLWLVKHGNEEEGAKLVEFALRLAPTVTVPRLAKGVWNLDRPLNRVADFTRALVVGSQRKSSHQSGTERGNSRSASPS